MSDLLNDTASWGLLVGVVLPLLTAVVQQPRWSPTVRRAVAVAAAVVGGVLTCLADGTLADGGTVLETVAVVLVASQALYATLWQRAAAAVETATSPGAQRHAA